MGARSNSAAWSPRLRFLAEFYPYLASLKETRGFVLCSDINIAHQEIDLKYFKGNKNNSGFLLEERAWMTELLRDADVAEEALGDLSDGAGKPTVKATRCGGMIDVYRKLQPTTTDEAYTWWSNRGQAYVLHTHGTIPLRRWQHGA